MSSTEKNLYARACTGERLYPGVLAMHDVVISYKKLKRLCVRESILPRSVLQRRNGSTTAQLSLGTTRTDIRARNIKTIVRNLPLHGVDSRMCYLRAQLVLCKNLGTFATCYASLGKIMLPLGDFMEYLVRGLLG